jgi:hypothetical protein
MTELGQKCDLGLLEKGGLYWVVLKLDGKVRQGWGPFVSLATATAQVEALERWLIHEGAERLTPEQARQ